MNPSIQARQLISRHDKESLNRSRFTSTLARQLERYRELEHVWPEQRKAVEVVLTKKEGGVLVASAEVDRLLVEKQNLDKAYTQKFDVLVRGLQREHEKAMDAMKAKRAELERSCELERETTDILGEEEVKNRALRCTLDRTMSQLNAVKTEMLQCQAAAEARGVQLVAGAGPRIEFQQQRIEACKLEKEHILAEAQATEDEVANLYDDLQRQRAYTTRLEEFVRRILSAPTRQSPVDPAFRKEAMRLIAAVNRRRDAEEVATSDGGFAAEAAAAVAAVAQGPGFLMAHRQAEEQQQPQQQYLQHPQYPQYQPQQYLQHPQHDLQQ